MTRTEHDPENQPVAPEDTPQPTGGDGGSTDKVHDDKTGAMTSNRKGRPRAVMPS